MSNKLSFYDSMTARNIEAAQTTFDEDMLAFHLLNIENWIRIHYADDELTSKLEEYGAFHNEQCVRIAKLTQSENTIKHLRSMLFDCATFSMSAKMLDALYNSAKASKDKEVASFRAALYGRKK